MREYAHRIQSRERRHIVVPVGLEPAVSQLLVPEQNAGHREQSDLRGLSCPLGLHAFHQGTRQVRIELRQQTRILSLLLPACIACRRVIDSGPRTSSAPRLLPEAIRTLDAEAEASPVGSNAGAETDGQLKV